MLVLHLHFMCIRIQREWNWKWNLTFWVEDHVFPQNSYTNIKTVMVRLDNKQEHLDVYLASC